MTFFADYLLFFIIGAVFFAVTGMLYHCYVITTLLDVEFDIDTPDPLIRRFAGTLIAMLLTGVFSLLTVIGLIVWTTVQTLASS